MFYLTDITDNELSNFKEAKSYSELLNNNENKILYVGTIDNNKNQKLRLRYWINDQYNDNDSSKSFSFKIKIVPIN